MISAILPRRIRQGMPADLNFDTPTPEGIEESLGQGMRFSLPKLFAAVGAALFILAGAGLTYFNMSSNTRQLERMAEANNVALTFALSEVVRSELDSLYSLARRLPARDLRTHWQIATLRQEVVRIVQGTPVVKIKIYDPTGLTVFSTDAKQIGEDKSGNGGFLSAIRGQVASGLTYRDQFDTFEKKISDRDLLSSYVPIYASRERTQPIGVFEIYTDVTDLKNDIEQTVLMGFILYLLVFALTYAALVYLVAVGNRRISEKHQENLRLAARFAKAQAANDAKSEFLANMSHELRTPLNAIIGFGEVIRDERFGPVGQPIYRDYANDIRKAGRHLLQIISAILDLVKIESGRMTAKTTMVSLADTIDSTVRMIEPQAEAVGLHLVVEVADDLPAIETDEGKLKQILLNLLSNAVKFAPPGGRLCVKAHWDRTAAKTILQVIDTGVGMEPEQIQICLAPFGRAEGTLSRKTQGTGLGLPLSRKLAELLGGDFAITSTPNKGTTVTIALPSFGQAIEQAA
jgi:two-component system cell cycle sensor histidine kinase PleC